MNFKPPLNKPVVPPGTASRLKTGAVPGNGRPGTRGNVSGTGIALMSHVQVTDRPVTQQGLRGPKTAANKTGNQRMVQDKTYFLGVLRNKVNDLTSEIRVLKSETDAVSKEQANFVNYEKRAESLAHELEDLRGELGDYNTLVDKINTETSISEMHTEVNELRTQNDRETNQLDALFEQKQQREALMKQLEVELLQEKNFAEILISDMNDGMRNKYEKLREENERLLKNLDEGQQQLDGLHIKKEEFDKQIMESAVKQEAVRLYENLRVAEQKRDQMMLEVQRTLNPQEEKEILLKQVRDDNAEIAVMERQSREMEERLEQLREESNQLDLDIDMGRGERNDQARELKKKGEAITEFLDHFDQNKSLEEKKIERLQMSIVEHLEIASRNLMRTMGHSLPSPEEFERMKDDLDFKEKEKQNSKNTLTGLSVENHKLHENLKNLEDLELKMSKELESLRGKKMTMSQDIEVFNDLDKLKVNMEVKRKKLEEKKQHLFRRRDTTRKECSELKVKSDQSKQKLDNNDMHIQLLNLERKWQHLEQSNFTIKEFISSKMKDCDYIETSRRVASLVAEYNCVLIDNLSTNGK